ncbi:MAG: STAS domain-containing protein [bacterium]
MNEDQDQPLGLEIEPSGQAAVVHIRGSVAAQEANQLRERLCDLATQKCSPIVLDVEGMHFIGSAGLSALVEAHLKTRHYKGQIRLLRPQPNIRRVFETMHLDRIFAFYTERRQAIEA